VDEENGLKEATPVTQPVALNTLSVNVFTWLMVRVPAGISHIQHDDF
jgi:hypothetical protein